MVLPIQLHVLRTYMHTYIILYISVPPLPFSRVIPTDRKVCNRQQRAVPDLKRTNCTYLNGHYLIAHQGWATDDSHSPSITHRREPRNFQKKHVGRCY
ncbi:hypothetical protein BDV24DRAFT_140794 [Aspergillus arachidicola]|uniref:Uncharacterized protein n=1 Tax=Aspergillus arachidicola TaxID=656916 RepID=A0A5N6XXV8_9EURO|nr:hypothetical protein BDV24DRAFT_140794 [Aspergillus arachidicola]